MADWRRIGTAALVLALAPAVAGMVGCGSSGSSSTTAANGGFAGLVQKQAKPVPPLALRDSLGKPVNIDDYRGKAVLVTFIYDHCPDVCPLIVGNLHTAQQELGAEAQRLQIIAVSVDPVGDTPRTVAAFLRQHQMSGKMQYLIGSKAELARTWRAWGITSKSTPTRSNPDAVEHSALVYGISGSGKVTTLYPSNFKPKEIVHDVPLLASS